MTQAPFNVDFLCTGNSAWSILAESLMNHGGRGNFRSYGAGSFPKGTVYPVALKLLRDLGFPIDGLRSKSWDEFAKPVSSAMDFVFTVCAHTAGQVCPIWPEQPVTWHWGVSDPAAVEGSHVGQWNAFRETFRALENRIKLFRELPITTLDRMSLAKKVQAIGRVRPDTVADQAS